MPGHIGALKSMEVLDFSGTELHNLPPEIGKLTHRKHLHLSFYAADDVREASYLPDGLFSTDIIAKLPDLQALSIGVHPKDKRWSRDVLVENEGRSEPVMPALEHLGIHYLWRLENICRKYSLPSGSFGALKSLTIDTCPKLKFLFDYSILRNISTLETLIVKDCVPLKEMVKYRRKRELIFPQSMLHCLSKLEELAVEDCKTLKEIIEEREVIVEDHGSALCSLKELKPRHLTELVRLWNSSIPYVEKHDIDGCPKLKDGKFEELSYQM
ncbi:hypothetical protein K7X08_027328 [Anisodus acutangulus]|uniref:Disease resistance protein At4g27190-like leucine-rich repeats domain-containing protein n=1 Tax=Anisodus acutangulus TaxID=402998 RepID=A0A9Q1MM68_9SOLA|nr:hypothetical protein K7X08_027328 [Anisodus acutangulus]